MSSRGDSDDFARGYGTRAGAAYSTRTPPPNDAEASPSRSLGSVSWRNTPAGVSDLDTPNSESVFSPHKARYPYTGPHTTAFARCTPILKDFSRRLSPPRAPRFRSPRSTPFDSN
ncbi:uncharacterized protein MICPUCDRAFT_58442 [Micromonas pusilla CCMP1545]|uniref:Predicted protein n=1 Tax=Micromonas pusilla (strain CCMP1545) TaxID=564608 RepID=C1MSD2_MICPC|nr:uncharacterized protein MICPUCDRAFT_58442 [Micromonas pusilla CCMP1545]EEH57487.1 predicted protein [Micromonas pusilla CCMP1545]|eukprot:XP_003059032.1 predicted protein [Micromonas pusilla CCMP1545]